MDQNPVIHLRAPTNAMRHGWRAGSFRASPKWEHPVFPGQLEISGRSAQRGFLSRQADRLPSRRRDRPAGPLRGYQIGRASCRERVWQYVSIPVVAVSLKKKKRAITATKL